jgi:hypothetical protein
MYRSILAPLAVAALLAICVTATAAPPLFLGKVTSVDAKASSFVMSGGSSRKYPSVTVLYDKKTAWSGKVPKHGRLKPNDMVRVLVTQVKDTTFRATQIEVLDPDKMKPAASKGQGSAGR